MLVYLAAWLVVLVCTASSSAYGSSAVSISEVTEVSVPQQLIALHEGVMASLPLFTSGMPICLPVTGCLAACVCLICPW